MDKQTAKVMWQVFQWAYRNDISIELFKERSYGDAEWPVLHFRRGDRHMKKALYQLTDVGEYMRSAWQDVAIHLFVDPFELEGD
jgi:hypothetical protein